MTTVPDLVSPRDPAPARRWRERRRARPPAPSRPVDAAVVTDGADRSTAAVLHQAGVRVAGLLGPDPSESLAWAAEVGARHAYADLMSLLADRVEAVCVELDPPASDVLAREAARAGLHVLLARPSTSGTEVLRAVARAAEDADVVHTVAFDARSWPAARHVQQFIPSLGRLRQLTVLGAPSAEAGRAEIIDLVQRWCGEILAVCADPSAMPAVSLTASAPVSLALLTGSGATALVHEQAGAALWDAAFCLSGVDGRRALSGDLVRGQDAGGLHTFSLPAPRGERPGLTEAAEGLRRGVRRHNEGRLRCSTLADLLAIAQVLEAADTSHKEGGWVEL